MNDGWTIKAKVIQKSDLKEFKKKDGTSGKKNFFYFLGKLFSITIVDKYGHEISATFFGNACEKYVNSIYKDKIYSFAKGQVKQNNYKYKLNN